MKNERSVMESFKINHPKIYNTLYATALVLGTWLALFCVLALVSFCSSSAGASRSTMAEIRCYSHDDKPVLIDVATSYDKPKDTWIFVTKSGERILTDLNCVVRER